MRITRMRSLATTAGYYNPEIEADKEWVAARSAGYPIRRAQAYREKVNELFLPFTSLGMYTVIFVTDGGDCLCSECARKVYLDERTDVTADVYWEGDTLYCDECNTEIESSYGPVE